MTVKLKSNLYVGPVNIFPNFWHCMCLVKYGSTISKVLTNIDIGLSFFMWCYIWPCRNEIGLHDDVIKWKHFPALLAICAGNSPVPVNSPHKGQWRGASMFSLICARINGWVNNREAGDLSRYRAHYDVSAMVHGMPHNIHYSTYIIHCVSFMTMYFISRTLTIHAS